MKSIITQYLRYQLVERLKLDTFSVSSNTYIGIGRPIRWGDDSNETADEIESPTYTINYRNQLNRDLVAIKKVQISDMALVVPRRDWVSGVRYDPYEDHIEIYSHEAKTLVGNANTISSSTELEEDENGIFTAASLDVGDIIRINGETREIVDIDAGNGLLNVNIAMTTTATAESMIKVSNTYPQFANNFYVRNSKDQVFKCLYNDGVNSTIQPEIDIDGQLPENPYILTGDGYKWKYLYTIPYGLKQKFFTNNWMPVVKDNTVVAGAINGRIDIITILDGGSGYYTIGQSGNSNTLPIISVVGDGTGANVTAKVESGVITDLNILNGGSGYTTAEIVVTDDDKDPDGDTASFDVIIGPPSGHGVDPARELGCFSIMISVELNEQESGKVPVSSSSGDFDFRQISLIRDPILSTGYYANGSVYTAATIYTLTDPGITNFINDETVYIGSTLETATFTGTVVYWDPNTNQLYLNNLAGTTESGQSITGVTSAAVATVLSRSASEMRLFTGDLLYIENRAKIIRDIDQSEQIRIVLSF